MPGQLESPEEEVGIKYGIFSRGYTVRDSQPGVIVNL